MITYKLNVIVAYSGAHYMIFIRVNPHNKEKVWTMFNDTDTPKQFHKGFAELAHFLVTSNAVPTLIMYEY
jgi:hypothetical protein